MGKFELTGIPPAPRGGPQIEVKFDVDANGILQVSAYDKASGKAEQITITNDQGRLTDDEIERMIKDAETHANEDAKKKEQVETRNLGEGLITSTEKMLEENKDKATEEEIQSINESKEKLSKILENDDASTEEMRNGIDELTKSSQSFAEKLYAETQQQKAQDENGEDVVEGEVVEEDE